MFQSPPIDPGRLYSNVAAWPASISLELCARLAREGARELVQGPSLPAEVGPVKYARGHVASYIFASRMHKHAYILAHSHTHTGVDTARCTARLPLPQSIYMRVRMLRTARPSAVIFPIITKRARVTYPRVLAHPSFRWFTSAISFIGVPRVALVSFSLIARTPAFHRPEGAPSVGGNVPSRGDVVPRGCGPSRGEEIACPSPCSRAFTAKSIDRRG